jgi:hypothetical protein
VYDVERAAGQHFSRRPFEPVPGKIQQPNRHPAIHERRACEIGPRG